MAATSSAAPPSRLNGKWKPNPAKSESIEPFLVEMGVSWLLRQAAKRQAPVMELTVTGTTFRQVMAGPMGKKTDNGGEFGTVRHIPSLLAALPRGDGPNGHAGKLLARARKNLVCNAGAADSPRATNLAGD